MQVEEIAEEQLRACSGAASAAVARAFRSGGLGILLVSFRRSEALPALLRRRWRLLSAAAVLGVDLAGEPERRSRILSDVGLGTDVPVSRAAGKRASSATPPPPPPTFSATLHVRWDAADAARVGANSREDGAGGSEREAAGFAAAAAAAGDMREMSAFMRELCVCVARACDASLAANAAHPSRAAEAGDSGANSGGGRPQEAAGPLEQAMTAPGSCGRARLIHYAAVAAEGAPVAGVSPAADAAALVPQDPRSSARPRRAPALSELGSWQKWHFDYGLFTALLGPALSCDSCHGDGVACTSAAASAAAEEGGGAAVATSAASGSVAAPSMMRSGGGGGGGGGGTSSPPACPHPFAVEEVEGDDAVARLSAISCNRCSGAAAGLVVLPSHSHDVDALADGALDGGVPSSLPARPRLVHLPPFCIAVQVGEAAQILSGGRLAATPHCVTRPLSAAAGSRAQLQLCCADWRCVENVSRAAATHGGGAAGCGGSEGASAEAAAALSAISRTNFVVFMQPAPDWRMEPEPMWLSSEPTPAAVGAAAAAPSSCEEASLLGEPAAAAPLAVAAASPPAAAASAAAAAAAAPSTPSTLSPGGSESLPPLAAGLCAAVLAASAAASAALAGVVPPLSARWSRGDTFADFSRATTRAYFGAHGVQKERRMGACIHAPSTPRAQTFFPPLAQKPHPRIE